MKAQWKKIFLGELCEILDFRRKPVTKRDRKLGEYPYYGATGLLDYVDEFLFDEKLVLVGEDGAKWGAGEKSAYFVEGKYWVNNHAHVLRPNRNMILDEWIVNYLNFSDLSEFVSGLTVPKLNQARLREIPIPLPPLPEQQRIVAVLDEAFAAIAVARANAERNLRAARELFESYLNEVFSRRGAGWVERTIAEVAQVKGGKRVPKGYKLSVEPTGYPYLRVTDFSDTGTINMDDLRYVNTEVHKTIKNYVIFSSDLYLSIAGTIGKTGIIPKELDGAHLTENACRLVFRPEVYNRFVYYFTCTKDFTIQAGVNTRTSAQPKLALSRLSSIKLGIPVRSEQEYLVKKFDELQQAIGNLEKTYQKKIGILDEMKQSILHHAFTGQL